MVLWCPSHPVSQILGFVPWVSFALPKWRDFVFWESYSGTLNWGLKTSSTEESVLRRWYASACRALGTRSHCSVSSGGVNVRRMAVWTMTAFFLGETGLSQPKNSTTIKPKANLRRHYSRLNGYAIAVAVVRYVFLCSPNWIQVIPGSIVLGRIGGEAGIPQTIQCINNSSAPLYYFHTP